MLFGLGDRVWQALRRYAPGTLVCIVIALASSFLSEHFGGPLLLYALLFGLAFHFLHKHSDVTFAVGRFCAWGLPYWVLASQWGKLCI